MLQSSNKNSKNNNNNHLDMNNTTMPLWLGFIIVNSLTYITDLHRTLASKIPATLNSLFSNLYHPKSQPDGKMVWKKQESVQFPAFMKFPTNKCPRAFGMISSLGFQTQLLRHQ